MKTQGFDYDHDSNTEFHRNPSIDSPAYYFYFVILWKNFVSNSCRMILKPSILYMQKDGQTDKFFPKMETDTLISVCLFLCKAQEPLRNYGQHVIWFINSRMT